MAIREQRVEYTDGEITFHGFLCYDDERSGALPAVLISHAWRGRSEFEERKARRLAWLGYVALAVDVFGEGKTGKTTQECQALIAPLMADRKLLGRRMNAALKFVRSLPQVDAARVAAMGFCFGGLCALDLARSGADVRGVVSFHGLLKPAPGAYGAPITSKVLILHGYDDPMAPPQEVIAIADEFKAAGVDWQLHAYGQTMHAFTLPGANDASFGTVYNQNADRRSWHTLMGFLEEVLR